MSETRRLWILVELMGLRLCDGIVCVCCLLSVVVSSFARDLLLILVNGSNIGSNYYKSTVLVTFQTS